MRPFYFRSGEYFYHCAEICIFSYPSPLEKNSHFLSKLLLLVLAGSIEYLVLSIVTDLLVTYSLLILSLLYPAPDEHLSDKYKDACRAIGFLLSFGFRTRRWTARNTMLSMTGRRTRTLLRRLAAFVFWNNPAVVCHCGLLFSCYVTGRSQIRIQAPRYFWVLIAPSLELGEVHLDVAGDRSKKKSFTSILWYSLGIALLDVLVKMCPSLLIYVALVAQNARHHKLPERAFRSTSKETSIMVMFNASRIAHAVQSNAEALESVISKTLLFMIRAFTACCGRILDLIASWAARGPKEAELYEDDLLTTTGQFRLLSILPGCGNYPIRCLLQRCPIDGKLNYTAVSYCWGSSDVTREVTVNGKRLLVTRSAFEALRALRSSYRTRVVWIDCLCIDQATEGDKMHQLPLMPRIYENAHQVVVWLGQSKTADLAAALVNRMFLLNRCRSQGEIKLPQYEMTVDAARALKRMLKASWFTRVWVVQEVVRARNKVVMRYGPASLTWDRFSWFTQSLQVDGSQLALLSNRIGYSGLEKVPAMQNLSMIRRFSLVKDDTLSLMFYLASTYRSSSIFDAAKPHDRIYSLVGLSNQPMVNLRPDYRIPLRQLFIDVVRNALDTTVSRHKLAFLNHAGTGYDPTVPGLPSWAPDWTIQTGCEPLLGAEGGSELLMSSAVKSIMDDAAALASFGQDDDAEEPIKRSQRIRNRIEEVGDGMKQMIFDATPSTEPCVKLHADNNILELKGCRLGHIISLGAEYPKAGSLHESTKILSEWVEMIAKHSPNQSTEGMAHRFFSILHHGQSVVHLDYTFNQMPIPLEKMYPANIASAFWQCIRHKMVDETLCPEPVQEFCKRFVLHAQRTCGGRRLGVTDRGYFGLFFPSNEIEDFVCLFSGSNLPFGIRRVGSIASGLQEQLHELVGPVYMDGFMQGIFGVSCLFDEMIRLQ